MSSTRTERDSCGTIEVPAQRLWGAQTQRSLIHFAISSERMPREFIVALALVKQACAKVNRDLGLLDVATAEAIVSGVAPGSSAVTTIVGKSTFGRSLTGRRR